MCAMRIESFTGRVHMTKERSTKTVEKYKRRKSVDLSCARFLVSLLSVDTNIDFNKLLNKAGKNY